MSLRKKPCRQSSYFTSANSLALLVLHYILRIHDQCQFARMLKLLMRIYFPLLVFSFFNIMGKGTFCANGIKISYVLEGTKNLEKVLYK